MSKKQSKKTSSNKNTARPRLQRRRAPRRPQAGKGEARPCGIGRRSGAPAAEGSPTTWQPNPRLPPVGTTISKRDRHGAVRCECTIEEGGIRYAATLYPSISAAAMAAANDLGLKNKTQNGFTFWGLTKPPRAPSDPVEAVTSAWERFHRKASTVLAEVTDENRTKRLERGRFRPRFAGDDALSANAAGPGPRRDRLGRSK